MEQGLLYQRGAHLLLHRSMPRESLAYAQSAIDLFEKLDIQMGTSKGTALAYIGEIDEGVAHSEGNWGAVKQAGIPLVVGLYGHEICLSLALARDVRHAKEWGEKVLTELERAGPYFESYVLRPLVLTYTLSGEIENALSAVVRETEIAKDTVTGCYLEDTAAIGLHYLRIGELKQAEKYLESAIERHEKKNTVVAVSGCRFALGSLYLEEEKFAEAEKMLRWSLEACQAGDNVLFELWILPVLAETYLKMDQTDRAVELIERGSALLTPDRNWYGLPAPIHTAKGMLAASQKDWEIAEGNFEKAVNINREFQLPWDEAKALFEWGNMEAGRKKKGEAAAKFDQSEEIFRKIGAKWDVEKSRAAKNDLGSSWISRLRK
jgi:tetratricopeptide (TPR) repeat protein